MATSTTYYGTSRVPTVVEATMSYIHTILLWISYMHSCRDETFELAQGWLTETQGRHCLGYGDPLH
jgi:hypothetical protein